MKKSALVLLLFALTAAVWGQGLSIGGYVVNDATGEAVRGASVSAFSMVNVAVVTNDDGFFMLKTDGMVEKVVVSHVGFQSAQIKLAGQPAEPLRIRLKPATIQLREVLVLSDNPRELVNRAISKIPSNYPPNAELYHCFYREAAMKRQHYVCVAEGVVDMYKTGYGRSTLRDRVAIVKGRRLLSAKQGDTLGVKVLGGPVAPVMLDLAKNTEFLLNSEELDCYDLKMETPTSINGRMQYVVSLAPRCSKPYALYFGRLFIDRETLAFTRAELSLDMSNREKATRLMLVRKPAGVRFRPKEMSMTIDYRLDADGVTRISYLRTTFRFNCDWKRRLFATSFAAFCELAVTDRAVGEARPIRGRDSFDQRDAFFDKVDYFRDPAFWQHYNIIEPSVSLDRAIHRLLKKYDQ